MVIAFTDANMRVTSMAQRFRIEGSDSLYACLCYRCCVLEFSYEAVDLQTSTSDCSIFTENEGLVQIKVIIISHNFDSDYTLH